MPSVFEVLSRDHEEVKQMLSEFEKGPTAANGASPDQLAVRKKMAETLVIEESKHEAVEEMYFWPTVRDRLPDGGRLADEATGQEQEAKQVLARLDKSGADDPEFEGLLGQFITAGREHIAFEETRVWPGLRSALTSTEAEELGEKLEQAKKTAPTRPHPGTPPSPGVLKSTGPIAAIADKAWDAVTGRGGFNPGHQEGTRMTRRYTGAASQARKAADKTADLWTQGAGRITGLIPRLPQIDLIPAVERYFDLVQRMVDINRSLTVKWVQAAGTLTGVARDQAESAADVVREMPASVGHAVHEQAAKAEQAVREQAAKAEQAEQERARQARKAEREQARQAHDQARERYEGLTKAELSDQLAERDLPKTGTVDELTERLIEADSK
ncbi:MAG TPA: hemerythrin domain-containing protein [Streptosporangiaceae bacterium]|nr:hemerythrin domain-containing protein [Streptosporangiaceae bacterium]